jgi:hypothetical protein
MKANGDQLASSAATPGQALLDFPAAQRYLGGISRSTLKLHVWRSLLQPTRIGKRVFFQRKELDRFIAERTGGAQ